MKIQHSLFVLVPVSLILIITDACKKSTSGPPETVLSKIYADGVLSLELTYYNDHKIQKQITYDNAGVPGYSYEFIYDAGGNLQEIHNLNKSGKITSKDLYTVDSKGNFTGHELLSLSGADSGKIIVKYGFEYTGRRLSKESWLDLVTGKEIYYRTYEWYNNGNLKHYRYYGSLVPAPELEFEITYSPAGDALPAAVSKTAGYPVNFDLFYFTAENVHSTLYSGIAVNLDVEEKATNREYNEKGLLVKQLITTYYNTPSKPKEQRLMTYEYRDL